MSSQSLAVIMSNRGEVVRRLSGRKSTPTSGKTTPTDEKTTPTDGKTTPTEQRSLEEVVSELNLVLESGTCSKAELIKAIENQLNISIGSCDLPEGKPRSNSVVVHSHPATPPSGLRSSHDHHVTQYECFTGGRGMVGLCGARITSLVGYYIL